MKRALITGILGQDGTYLARWMIRQGYEVHGLIRKSPDQERDRIAARFSESDRDRLQFHSGSVSEPDLFNRLLGTTSPDEVYHLAGVSDSRQSFLIPEETVQTITVGSLRLLEACRQTNPKARIFVASSCEVFGPPEQSPQTLETPRRPATPYGIAKNAMDQFVRIYRDHHGSFVCSGILYNHESPLRPANYLSSRVAKAVAEIHAGRSKELVLGNLDSERDWSDARDFVRGFHLSLQAATPADYIFASGQSRTVADLVECAFKAAGLDYREFVRVEQAQTGVVPVRGGLCGDVSATEKSLGWQRKWSFAETLADMVQAEIESRPTIRRTEPD
ncbi:MAG TPA: GDP-mannose 4,6-dehydratase [Roseimicrobium sp.]|nr:GDP-mannose 4,6-dehydratase [Roseimicrobium sp.]